MSYILLVGEGCSLRYWIPDKVKRNNGLEVGVGSFGCGKIIEKFYSWKNEKFDKESYQFRGRKKFL